MRLVVARCSVQYSGRLDATLPEAVRLIMVKADGCVAIHSDGGAYKPLNWMNAPNVLVEQEGSWVVSNPKGETLTITFTTRPTRTGSLTAILTTNLISSGLAVQVANVI
jgi:RecB family endonuclease NucS